MRYLTFLTIILLLCLGLYILRLPDNLSHIHYVSGDAGSCLHAAQLISEGKTPWVDFSFNYGCASLWLSQLWFFCFGYTPLAYLGLNLLCALGTCWGIARIIHVLQCPRLVCLFVLLSTPYIVGLIAHHTAQCVECVLLVHYLVFFLQRRNGTALFLATLALVFKPGLAFFAGFFLLVDLIFHSENRSGIQQCWYCSKKIIPSFLLLLLYSLLVGWQCGGRAVIISLIPFPAMRSYENYGFGLLRAGKTFWLPEKENLWLLLRYYIFSPAGIWIFGTLYLLFQTARELLTWRPHTKWTISQRCLVICGLLHLAFLLFLFGGSWSWMYSPYLVVLGVAAALQSRQLLTKLRLAIIACFIVLGLTATFRQNYYYWLESSCYPDFHYLFMPPLIRQEYSQIEKLSQHYNVLILQGSGAASLFLNNVSTPPAWMLLNEQVMPAEAWSIHSLLRSAQIVVTAIQPGMFDFFAWPELQDELSRFKFNRRTQLFRYLVDPDLERAIAPMLPPAQALPESQPR